MNLVTLVTQLFMESLVSKRQLAILVTLVTQNFDKVDQSMIMFDDHDHVKENKFDHVNSLTGRLVPITT